MSEQKSPTEVPEEESSGFLSLEAKAGLTLICLLGLAFSYMVWQKWKEMKGNDVADSGNTQRVEAEEQSSPSQTAPALATGQDALELLLPDESPSTGTDEPEIVALNPLEDKNSEPAPMLNLETTDEISTGDENPFAEAERPSPRRPANIPVLEVAEEKPAENTTDSADPFDPFGDGFKAVPSESPATPSVTVDSNAKPADEFDPFATETVPAETAMTPPAESPPKNETLETAENPFAEDKKSAAVEMKEDPFATAPDPFTDPQLSPQPAETGTKAETPTLEFAESEPKPAEMKPEPTKTVEADPFSELDSKPSTLTEKPQDKHPLVAESGKPVKVAPADSFQEPLPLLEPVPEKTTKPADDPFGDFESVPAGASQASSVTQVSPGPANERRSGTLAELNSPRPSIGPANANLSPFDNNPFATLQPQPKPAEFRLNPDGTYDVRQGDSYWIISRNAYGTSRYYRALAEYNRNVIPDPQQMPAGKTIAIPPARELERRLSHLISATPAAPPPSIVMASAEQETGFFTDKSGNPMYSVQENDTLTSISQRHLGRPSRWIQIFELNRDKLSNPNQLKIGTILKLPGDASRVRIVRGQ